LPIQVYSADKCRPDNYISPAKTTGLKVTTVHMVVRSQLQDNNPRTTKPQTITPKKSIYIYIYVYEIIIYKLNIFMQEKEIIVLYIIL